MNDPELYRRSLARFRNSPEVQQAINRLALHRARREVKYRRRLLLASGIALGVILGAFTLLCWFGFTLELAKHFWK